MTITHIFIYIKRSRYILIFEENYGRFVALSSLLSPNFNALLNPIQGLLRKPRLLLTTNYLPDFSSTVFYEKISGIPASWYLWIMVSYERRAITYLLSNPQSATSNRQCSYPPSPLSSPRRVEEILIINCHLPIVVFGRPHRVALTDNLALIWDE